jgi:hypothetical protein
VGWCTAAWGGEGRRARGGWRAAGWRAERALLGRSRRSSTRGASAGSAAAHQRGVGEGRRRIPLVAHNERTSLPNQEVGSSFPTRRLLV